MNTQSIRDELMHYHRTCLSCGENWWGLHCPHDGIQNPCSACGMRPNTVPTKNGCDCEFVMPESDITTYLEQQIAVARIDEAKNSKAIYEHSDEPFGDGIDKRINYLERIMTPPKDTTQPNEGEE